MAGVPVWDYGKDKNRGLVQERLEVRKKVEKNTAAKKTVEKKTVSAVKAAEPVAKVEETPEVQAETPAEEKTQAPAAEPVVEEKPAEAAKTAAKKTEKSAAAKKTTKAATAKKEPAEKPAKTTKAAASQKIVLQMSGREELSMEGLVERVKQAYVNEGHSAASIKNVEVYIKPEEGMAYYVIDGYASGISL